MKTKVSYEWDVEMVDLHGDITDHRHSDACPTEIPEGGRLVLVRDVIAKDGNLEERSWAYVDGKVLPIFFEDSSGRWMDEVPKRFFAELIRAIGVPACLKYAPALGHRYATIRKDPSPGANKDGWCLSMQTDCQEAALEEADKVEGRVFKRTSKTGWACVL